ncbi:MAG: hypothetical protein ACXABY_28225 [Candidatus Thorarchaeota archaeon]|jgi:transcription initiation factor IIE alpha subunit
MVFEGNCPECRHHVYGWALQYPQHQTCPECGAKLKITDPDHSVIIEENYRSSKKKRIIDLFNTPIFPNHGEKKENDQDSK